MKEIQRQGKCRSEGQSGEQSVERRDQKLQATCWTETASERIALKAALRGKQKRWLYEKNLIGLSPRDGEEGLMAKGRRADGAELKEKGHGGSTNNTKELNKPSLSEEAFRHLLDV